MDNNSENECSEEEYIKKVCIFENKQNTHTKKINKTKIERKRVETLKWDFDKKYYLHENQVTCIETIKKNNYVYNDTITKIILQQIHRKIYGYKQQDIIKNKLNNDLFITLQCIIDRMLNCNLKCYYCCENMNVLYDISRENKQWSVDRIDNSKGHNIDNFYLACLECNLKRRTRNDNKFLFTKQLKIVKTDNDNNVLY